MSTSAGVGGDSSAASGCDGRAADGSYTTAKTSVWWDIENCHVPRSCDPYLIAQNISSALVAMEYRGPISISAYGDTNKINAAAQQALSSTGVSLNHVPAGVKDASDKKILVDMLFWAVDNPPPANYLLISGDRDFSNALHQLRMRRYNILLAQPFNVSLALTSAAKCVWQWTDIVAGRPSLPYHTNGNGISSEDRRNNNVEVRRPCDLLPSKSNLTYQKVITNGKVDIQVKGKQQAWRTQNQPNTNIFRTACNEGMQSQTGCQSPASIAQITKTSITTKLNAEGLLDAHDNYSGDSPSISRPSIMAPDNSLDSRKPEGRQFRAPHEFFETTNCSTPKEPTPTFCAVTSHNVSISQPSTIKTPHNSNGLHKPGVKHFNAPHEFFGAAKPSTSKGTTHS